MVTKISLWESAECDRSAFTVGGIFVESHPLLASTFGWHLAFEVDHRDNTSRSGHIRSVSHFTASIEVSLSSFAYRFPVPSRIRTTLRALLPNFLFLIYKFSLSPPHRPNLNDNFVPTVWSTLTQPTATMTEEKVLLQSFRIKSQIVKEFLGEFIGTFILVVCVCSMCFDWWKYLHLL